MNVASPSSRGSIARTRVESTYEDDLLGLLDQLSPDEIDELHMYFAHRIQNGYPPSDHDIAVIDLMQQVRQLASINEDRVLAQRMADGEDNGTETEESNHGEDVETESSDEENVGSTTEESTDGEDAAIETEENRLRQRRLLSVRNRIARLIPRRSWVSSLISRLSRSKPILARRARVVVSTISVVRRLTSHNCVACRDPIQGVGIHAPCGHYYDIDCATHVFQAATRDETLFPPRCCGQNIPLARVRAHLSRTLIATFKQKQVEFGTLKRVYCSSPTCSRFLGPVSEGVFGGRVYTCPALGCRRRTCGKCREQHSGDRTHVCCPDAGATQVLELSRTSGWARCPGCSHMIELHLGCFHTTCRCGTEFCYLCRALWKTCDCPQWDEDRLVVDGDESDDE